MKKIAILTTFKALKPGYSLTTIVQDQIRMLTAYGHDVHLFVDEVYNGPPPLGPNEDSYTFHKTLPHTDQIDYKYRKELSESHKLYIKKLKNFFIENLKDIDLVFTHDYISIGWHMPYAFAIQEATQSLPNTRWLNWVHSIPTSGRDWWSIREYGNKHRIVFPNKTDIDIVALNFRGKESNVRIIPHIKDVRSFFEFDDLTCRFIKDHPKILSADLVKVYPASSDRLKAKGVDKIILLMAHLKRMGWKVFTVIVNQHANKRSRKERVSEYENIANRNGLDPRSEFVFTSSWDPSLDEGLPQRAVRELFQCSNVFIYPTKEESFGLVGPEAVLAGCPIVMLNRSLDMMMEVNACMGMYSEFGSYRRPFKSKKEGSYYRYLANRIVGQFHNDMSVQHKTFIRKRYNWDYVYTHDYAPVMAESEGWV